MFPQRVNGYCRKDNPMRMHNVHFVLLFFASVVAAPAWADNAGLYRPKGHQAWDFWFARSGDTYYAFYLQAPDGLGPNRFGRETVGLATSKDLVHWSEYGEILRANPQGQWCNHHIATGSTWRGKDRWQMLFTACGGVGGNIGLAESENLIKWTMVGPARINFKSHVVPEDPYWQRRGLQAGETVRYSIFADPYVLPEPIDGWYYMIANCGIVGRPLNHRGCMGLMRTRDGRTWTDCGIIGLMLEYDRPETPQLWKHGDRWYLYFGGAREQDNACRENRIYTARSIQGPFAPSPRSKLKLPDGRRFYIAKVIADPQGRDVLLGCIGGAQLSRPYLVRYDTDGSIALETSLDDH